MDYDQELAQHYNRIINEKLVGYKIVGSAIDPNGYFGFILSKNKDKHEKIVWILSDPEGNGAGALDLQSIK